MLNLPTFCHWEHLQVGSWVLLRWPQKPAFDSFLVIWYHNVPGLSCTLPALHLQSTISLRSLGFFWWVNGILRSQSGSQGCSLILGWSLFLDFFVDINIDTHKYSNTYMMRQVTNEKRWSIWDCGKNEESILFLKETNLKNFQKKLEI